jgi:hypothetical protein
MMSRNRKIYNSVSNPKTGKTAETEITFKFLNDSDLGKHFAKSNEGAEFFDSEDGNYFLSTPDGQKFLSTTPGKEWCKQHAKNWAKNLQGQKQILSIFSNNDSEDKLEIMKFATSKSVGRIWHSSDFGKNTFKEFFCADDGMIGYKFTQTQEGDEWVNFDKMETIFSFKDSFFSTRGGKKWMEESHHFIKFIDSEQGREWFVGEGAWILNFWVPRFSEDFLRWVATLPVETQKIIFQKNNGKQIYIDIQRSWFKSFGQKWFIDQEEWIFDHLNPVVTQEILDWILTAPESIQKKFLQKDYVQKEFVDTFSKWFVHNSKNLFNKKIIGTKYQSFDEYLKKLKEILNENHFQFVKFVEEYGEKKEYNIVSGNEENECNDNEEENYDVEADKTCFMEFLFDWNPLYFWLFYSQENQNKFKKIFCDEDGSRGKNLLESKDGKRFLETPFGRAFLSFIGNDFLKTPMGQRWLFDQEKFLYSSEGKDWMVREGDWVIDTAKSFTYTLGYKNHREADEMVDNVGESHRFLNWTITTPMQFQQKYFSSYNAEWLLVEYGHSWFEKHGDYLFKEKLMGSDYENFKEYQEKEWKEHDKHIGYFCGDGISCV